MSRAAVLDASIAARLSTAAPVSLHPLESLVRASSPAAQAFDARCDGLGPNACLSLCVAVLFGLKAPPDDDNLTSDE